MAILVILLLLADLGITIADEIFNPDGRDKLKLVAMLCGVVAGILTSVAISKTPGSSSGNPYFLYTLIVIFFAFGPLGAGFGIAEAIKKRKK